MNSKELKNFVSCFLASPWTIKNGFATAPVTMMTEGIHCGSAGCVLHKAEILKKNIKKFENIPIVINHPQVNGQNVSVKEVPNEIIGYVRDVYFDNKKKGVCGTLEIPSDYTDLSKVQKVKEVSVGLFSEDVEAYGNVNEEPYEACCINIFDVDHLALLTEATGACSWEDGCGIRNNKKEKEALELQLYIEKNMGGVYKILKKEALNETDEEVLMPTNFNFKEKSNDDKDLLLPPEFYEK